jgi:hypothetical protein
MSAKIAARMGIAVMSIPSFACHCSESSGSKMAVEGPRGYASVDQNTLSSASIAFARPCHQSGLVASIDSIERKTMRIAWVVGGYPDRSPDAQPVARAHFD